MGDINYLNSTMMELIEQVKNANTEELDTTIKRAQTIKDLSKQVGDNYRFKLEVLKVVQTVPDDTYKQLATALLTDNV